MSATTSKTSSPWWMAAHRSSWNFRLLRPGCGRSSPPLGASFWTRAVCRPCLRHIWAPMKRAKLVRASCCRESKPCLASVISDRRRRARSEVDPIRVQTTHENGQRIASLHIRARSVTVLESRGSRLSNQTPPEAAGGQEVAGSSPVAPTGDTPRGPFPKSLISTGTKTGEGSHPVVVHDRPVDVPLVEPPSSFRGVVLGVGVREAWRTHCSTAGDSSALTGCRRRLWLHPIKYAGRE